MKKYFTKDIAQPLKVIVLGLALGLGVSIVSANWTPPPATAPGCPTNQNVAGCDAPINVSATGQGKDGASLGAKLFIHGLFGADRIYGAESFNLAGPTGNGGGTFIADGKANIFGQLKLDLSYGGGGGTDVLNLVGNTGSDHIGIVQNKPNLTFWDSVLSTFTNLNAGNGIFNRTDVQDQDPILQVNRGGQAGLTVEPGYSNGETVRTTFNGKVAINDGTAGSGKVFASTNGNGMGAWADLSTSGGVPLSGNDVVVLGRYYDNDGSSEVQNAWAYCPSGYVALSGGGDCEGGKIRITQPIHSDFGNPGGYAEGPGWSDQNASNSSNYTYLPGTDKVANYGRFPNGWQLACDQGNSSHLDLRINVVCLKITPVTVSANVSSGGGTGGGTGGNNNPDAGWTTPPLGSFSANNQSCATWLGNHTFRVKMLKNGVVSYINGECVRTSVTGGSYFLVHGSKNTVNGRGAAHGFVTTSNQSDPDEGAEVWTQYQ